MSFVFVPSDGYRNPSSFPTNPANEADFRNQMMTLLDQLRDYINNDIVNDQTLWNNGNSPASNSANGYQQLASGVIIQWGSVTVPGSSSASVTFPIAFPNVVRSIQTTVGGTASAGSSWNASSTTGFTVYQNFTSVATVFWLAIGY